MPLWSDSLLPYPRFVLQAKKQNKLNHLLHFPSPFHFKFVLIFNADTKVIELPGQIVHTAAPSNYSLDSVVKHPPILASLYFFPHKVTAPKNSHPKGMSQSPQSIHFWSKWLYINKNHICSLYSQALSKPPSRLLVGGHRIICKYMSTLIIQEKRRSWRSPPEEAHQRQRVCSKAQTRCGAAFQSQICLQEVY